MDLYMKTKPELIPDQILFIRGIIYLGMICYVIYLTISN
jgi:hypothetical protein